MSTHANRKVTRLPSTLCPKCGTNLDACTDALNSGAPPSAGDVTMCLHCGILLMFEADLNQRVATNEEIAALPQSVRDDIERGQRERMRMLFDRARRLN